MYHMTLAISAEIRKPGMAESDRGQGKIPAIMYGPEITAASIAVDATAFTKLYRAAGESTLVDLSVGGAAPVKVLIQDVQFDPVKSTMIHVDFRQINMSKEMHATVALRFVGESPAVKGLGGTLVKPLEEVNVKCLPKDLVNHIDIDLSVLKTFADFIRVSDIPVPAGMTILDTPTTTIAKVAAPLTEDQLKALEAAGPQSLEDIEIEKKGKEPTAEEAEAGAEAATDKGEKKEEKKKE